MLSKASRFTEQQDCGEPAGFDDAHKAEALRTLGRFASDPKLPSFTWYDAACLSQRIRHNAMGKVR